MKASKFSDAQKAFWPMLTAQRWMQMFALFSGTMI
ncbi:hypothetical protein ACSSV1_005723 [Labrenzia sp. MBR-25]